VILSAALANPVFHKGFSLQELTLGIDVGGTKVALALGDRAGRVRARRRRPTESTGRPEEDVARITRDVEVLLHEEGVETESLAAVGVSLPGPLDLERGMVVRPPNLPGWDEVPVRSWLTDALGAPVALENDANANALAEWRFGAGRGHEDVVYLTMSTGVGAGLILDGRLHRGMRNGAGEVGHTPVEWPGEPCSCGLRGCLEAYVGGAAWTRRLRAQAPETSRVIALAGGRDALTPEHVVQAAGEGDAFALSELERFNDYLARAIVSLAFTLAPSVIILGTIAVAAGEALCFAPLRKRVREHLWAYHADELEIVPAALGDELPYASGLAVALELLRARTSEG